MNFVSSEMVEMVGFSVVVIVGVIKEFMTRCHIPETSVFDSFFFIPSYQKSVKNVLGLFG